MNAPMTRLRAGLAALMLAAAVLPSGAAGFQPPGKGKGPPAEMRADQEVFHFLLGHHKDIRRTVKNLPDGVETLTESDKPEVAKKIQEHVASMHKRVKDGRGLRFWDDLFVAIFKHYDKIEMKVENTAKGVRVKETSAHAFTVRLIQAHAEVVSRFVKHGFDEAHKSHPVPAAGDGPKLTFPAVEGFGGVVALPRAAEQPRAGAKVVFDITASAKDDEPNKGLVRVARLLNLYGVAGRKASDVQVAVVLHGDATRSALNAAAYKARHGTANPNLALIASLRKAGVEVFVCGQALSYSGFKPAEVEAGVPVALSALTVVVNRGRDGYLAVQVP